MLFLPQTGHGIAKGHLYGMPPVYERVQRGIQHRQSLRKRTPPAQSPQNQKGDSMTVYYERGQITESNFWKLSPTQINIFNILKNPLNPWEIYVKLLNEGHKQEYSGVIEDLSKLIKNGVVVQSKKT